MDDSITRVSYRRVYVSLGRYGEPEPVGCSFPGCTRKATRIENRACPPMGGRVVRQRKGDVLSFGGRCVLACATYWAECNQKERRGDLFDGCFQAAGAASVHQGEPMFASEREESAQARATLVELTKTLKAGEPAAIMASRCDLQGSSLHQTHR